MESISSTKIIDGALALATSNKARTSCSDSPYHLLANDDDWILKKVELDSVAAARASMVLPVPGGPNSSIPVTGSRNPLNRSGRKNG